MTQEKKLTKTQKLRLKKLAHQIKGLPEKQKKECMDLLDSYERWHDYAAALTPGTEEYNHSVWERNMYQHYLQFTLHYALTGDVFSRSGAIVTEKYPGFASPETRKFLDKRTKELVEIYNAIDIFGQASKEERDRFKKELKSGVLSRLIRKKRVPDQSLGKKTSERSFMKD